MLKPVLDLQTGKSAAMYAMVKEFHKCFGHPYFENEIEGEIHFDYERMALRGKWILDEITELKYAGSLWNIRYDSQVDFVDSICDALYFLYGCYVEMGFTGNREYEHMESTTDSLHDNAVTIMQCKTAEDSIFFIHLLIERLKSLYIRFFPDISLRLLQFFTLVHEANMRKLGSDGKPIYNAHGKVQKPAGWFGPEKEIKLLMEI